MKKHLKTKLTAQQMDAISAGTPPIIIKFTINAPINIKMNIGILIIAGNTYNGGTNTINFNQHI